MTPISLIRCRTYDPAEVGAALDRALEPFGGLSRFVKRGDRVLLKPNLVSRQPAVNAATTHPALFEALLPRLLDLGAKPAIGDSPAFGWGAKVADACGIGEVARKYGVPMVEFTQPVRVACVRPGVLPHVTIDREITDADVVINLPKLKTHRQLGFTGAVKNLYGCMPGKKKAWFHMVRGNRDMQFAHVIAAFAYTVAPQLHIADGIVAMERDGPVGGDPRPLGALAVGEDGAAVDTVFEALIRPRPEDSLVLNACRALRLGETDMAKIDVLGERVEDMSVSDFRHAHLVGVRFSPGRLARSTWRQFLLTRLAR